VTDDRAKSGPISPEDHDVGDACIDDLVFNGEFLTANAAPAAGSAIPVACAAVIVVTCSGVLGDPRPPPAA
jgi:hypothetical protein